MENEMDDLKSIWKSAKDLTAKSSVSAADLIQQAEAKKKSALLAHYGNIAVLSAVALMLVFTYIYVTPFRELLSRIGVILMIGGLILRIAIEFFSIVKSNKVRVSDTTAQATEEALAFYAFRKKIHGPVTITIVALYIIGFFILTPELSKYVEIKFLIIADLAALASAPVLIYFIRKGLKKELEDLKAVAEINKQLRNVS